MSGSQEVPGFETYPININIYIYIHNIDIMGLRNDLFVGGSVGLAK